MRQNDALPLLVCLRCGLEGRQVGTDLFPEGRAVLDSLLQGNFHPPNIPRPSQPQEPSDDSQWEETDDQDNQNNTHVGGNHDSINLYHTWDSIPWSIAAPVNHANRFQQLLNPKITADMRAHDRNIVHHTRSNNWKRVMTKLFLAYLWLKEKTNSWNSENPFDCFTPWFCKCNVASPRSS
ncbi:hypothetical protein PCANC_10949 [Puccinia coronata f. sp. avenae]|nr:hypothetical protein PCANC_10949 [Puccinia coronata f. sp. avenae]